MVVSFMPTDGGNIDLTSDHMSLSHRICSSKQITGSILSSLDSNTNITKRPIEPSMTIAAHNSQDPTSPSFILMVL